MPLVYLSSTRLYDGQPGFAGAEVDEDTPLALDPAQPRHLYDLSKALGESLCRQASGGRARIARLTLRLQRRRRRCRRLSRHACLARLRAPDRGAGPGGRLVGRRGARLRPRRRRARRRWSRSPTRGTRPLYNVAGGVNVANRELFARLGELAGCELRALRDGPAPCPAAGLDRTHAERVRLAAPGPARPPAGARSARPCRAEPEPRQQRRLAELRRPAARQLLPRRPRRRRATGAAGAPRAGPAPPRALHRRGADVDARRSSTTCIRRSTRPSSTTWRTRSGAPAASGRSATSCSA